MRPEITLTHEFVEFIPDELKECTVYVSIRYKTVIHLCCCGCGREVVTPLSPAAWKLLFDGVSVSLYPSIGNWNLPCKSHYWIDRNRVKWSGTWSAVEIEAGRTAESRARAEYYGEETSTSGLRHTPPAPGPVGIERADAPLQEGFWRRLWRLIRL